MKKIGAFFCLMGSLLGSGSLLAQNFWETHWPENVWDRQWEKSFLIGLLGGYADRQGSLLATVNYAGFPLIPQAVIARDISDTGLIYGFLAGYQGQCQKWILGLEFNVESHQFAKNHPFAFSDSGHLLGWSANARYERNWMAGLTARAGYYIVDYLMPYVRFGAETGRDQLETTFLSNTPVLPELFLHDKVWVWRFLSGVGIEFPIYCTALTMRVEYQFHSKGKTIQTDRIFTDGVVNPIFNSNMQPSTQTGIIALVRNFS